MNIQIKNFDESDAVQLSKMIYKTIDQLEKENPEINYQMVRNEDTPDELLKASKEGIMWIAVENNKVVGTISLQDIRVRRFFVHPKCQGQGIGKRLMNKVKNYMKDNNIKEIWVGALIKAYPIYKKLGFKEGKTFFNPEINQEEMEMKFKIK